MLPGLAKLMAFGFEFVDGFPNTANAVAYVICTHALPPLVAVVRSGDGNLIGALASSDAEASGIVSLPPVESIRQVAPAWASPYGSRR